jgi:hypothetical protein
MQKSIQFNKEEKCFLVNNKIKVDTEYVERLQGKKNLNNLIKLEDNLYYYKDKSLIELLFEIDEFDKIIFKNNDSDDYRLDNLIITKKKKPEFNKPLNVKILKKGKPKLATIGSIAGQYRNMYWRVLDESTNKEYYIMHINDETYTKFSIEDKNKILDFDGERPSWYLHSNVYIATMLPYNNTKKTVYLHQYLMDVHFEDNTDMEKTVDHINRDKFDNRRENLRFASMTEQNLNKDKQNRQKNACPLPECIDHKKDLPIHVVYNNRCYDKENNSWREFFTIENHPKQNDKTWATSKSNKVSIKEKLEQAKLKLKHLNSEITDEEYRKQIEKDIILPPYFRLPLPPKEKYILYYEKKFNESEKYVTSEMTLTHNDLQLMMDKFVDKINGQILKKNKDENINIKLIDKFKLEKPILLDFSNVTNKIIEETETTTESNNTTEENQTIEKYQVKPKLPPNFWIGIENNKWNISYSKVINKKKLGKKRLMNSMCIQTEINKLINEINDDNDLKHLNLQKVTIENPLDFTDKTPINEKEKPKLIDNFCIVTLKNIDSIQFSKTINKKPVSFKRKITSYDLQKELDDFIDYLNLKEEYNFNLEKKFIKPTEWKTTNTIKN